MIPGSSEASRFTYRTVPATGHTSGWTAFCDSSSTISSPASTRMPGSGRSTNTNSPSWLTAYSVRPTTAGSTEASTQTCSSEYSRCSGTSRFNGVSFASLMPPAYNATRRRPNHTMGPAPPWGHRCGPIRQRTDVGGIGRYISGPDQRGSSRRPARWCLRGSCRRSTWRRPRTCSRSRASRSAPDRRPGCRSSSSPPCGSPRRR